MFYKRISDLHPLGKLKSGSTNWNNLEPIPFEKGKYYEVARHTDSYDYTTTGSLRTAETDIPYSDLQDIFESQVSGKKWYNSSPQTQTGYEYVTGSYEDQPPPPGMLDSEYFARSLWFEVAIGKNSNNVPVSQGVHHYQSKRVNAYLLFTNINEISADRIDAPMISTLNLHCNDIYSTRITANKIDATSITANYGDISSINVTSITSQAISSELGIINNLSGDKICYHDGYFTNITVTHTADLTAEAAYWADLAEMYTADSDYRFGTLVKFGGEKEITIADDKANAVISEKPAITMNSQNKDKNALPIVLTGRSKVRTIHEIKKFDKIYLSEIPGVGTSEKYKIPTSTTPIGIALENKPYDEEGLIECILQLNFE